MTEHLVPQYKTRLERVLDLPARTPLNLTKMQTAAKFLQEWIGMEDREHFVVLMLDAKLNMIGASVISIGVLDSTIITMRELFKVLILANAHGFMVAHNHPSGDMEISQLDLNTTVKIMEASGFMDVRFVDHIIVSHTGGVSIRKEYPQLFANCP